ncbi:3-oxoacyl-[acyl-carrier-protein] synthase III C-terminal domain-containing protein [Roseofilum casamattae]|uniref:3-oxoacyl-[acyl-carrier-protein] synthase III C-terminal domain-containing protein n=1 Tax=Roseofilum casamattae BLCC-M143 TaxID=3022442 RepID=A0ABT7BYG4_9CYAN|nr:3-oxoacyl-[acyl-carrier-protein] synthase III C-terminal domain-containing protein [Roseofilum casamattae]MDJ1184239.1 3-oxoacyl-[acyl-carrier-protein] synthase III C-terminal domain-containing protein [Roseofilum casamattae BLCC-M143]
MNASIGIRSLTLAFPNTIRTNDYWRERCPHLLPKARKRQRNVATMEDADLWSQAVAPYLADPFRGAKERRILQPEESGLALESRAAKEAIALAGLTPEAVDLALVTALFPDRPGPGHAAYLAREIGLHCPAWNIESTCSSVLVALETARTFIASGRYEHILIVVSHFGSNATDNSDSFSWSLGDGAGALIVSLVPEEEGILSVAIAPATETCNAYRYELADNSKGQPHILARTGDNAISLAETAVDAARSCCQKAAEMAGVSLTDIDFFAFNTPTAWYADVCIRALGIDRDRALNLYPRYSNIGPVFPLANLERAARVGKLNPGDLVLIYANGAAATSAAVIIRWGETVLGEPPAPPLNISATEESIASCVPQEEQISPKLPSYRDILTALPPERPTLVATYLLGWLAVYLQCSPEELSADLSFGGLVDSLVAIELKRRLEEDFRIPIPLQQFLGENNSDRLAAYLCDRLLVKELKNTLTVQTDRPREIVHL